MKTANNLNYEYKVLKKNIIRILLILVFIIPVLGTYTWFIIEKNIIRKQIKLQLIEGIYKEELISLKFCSKNNSELNWKDSKEFEYKGEMFDIIETEIKNDSIIYKCFPDKQETEINIKINNLLNFLIGNNKQPNEKHNKLLDFIKKLYFSYFSFQENHFSISKENYVFFSSKLYTTYLKSFEIPPEY